MLLRVLFAPLAAVAVLAAPVSAQDRTTANPLALFQQREGLLFDTGWQLARANRAFCPQTMPSIGLLVHDVANYARPDEVRSALQLAGDIGVQAVAKDSPAASEGIGPNWTLKAIGGDEVAEVWKPTKPGIRRTLQIEEELGRRMRKGPVTLALVNGPGRVQREASFIPVEICAAKFRLTPDDTAYSSTDTVFFGDGFMAFGLSRDPFAAAVAHELAHVIQNHPGRKESERWSWRETRRSEREADRMMPWLMFNAGYDPDAAADWMRAWGPKHSGGLLRKRTHDGWDERLAMIVAETAVLKRLIAANDWKPGEADWSRRFPALRD